MRRASVPSSNTFTSGYSGNYDRVSVTEVQNQNDALSMDSTQENFPSTRKAPEPEVVSISSDEIASQLLDDSRVPPASEHRERWNSFWLNRTALVGILVAAVSILITIIILNRSSSSRGFPAPDSSNRYLWAYLPTTVFVALAALWHQVDHQCRVLTPWTELWNGPAPANKTLLLDYISPLNPVVLWKALQNRHWAVAASTTASVLLDICVLFSTSLLSVRLVTLTELAPIIPFQTMLSTTNTSTILNQPDSAFVYYGINTFQIMAPVGSDAVEAYEVPDFDQLRSGTYAAEISTFQSNLDCRVATTSHSLGQSIIANTTYPIVHLNISTSECETQQSFRLANLGLNWTADSMQTILGGDNRNVTCREQDNWSNLPVTSLFIVDVQSQYIPGFISPYGPGSEFDRVNLTINASTVLLCRMAAAVVKQHFEFDTTTGSGSASNYNFTHPRYVNESLLQQAVFGTLDTLDGSTRPGPQQFFKDTDQSGVQGFLSPFIAFINMEFQNYNLSMTRLTDTKWLSFCAESTFSGLVAQIARTSFSMARTHTYNGTYSYDESRAFIQLEPTAIIGTCLLLMSILTIAVFRCRPWNVVPRDPSSVLGLATILASSSTLNRELQQKSTLSEKELGLSLQQTSLRTMENPAFEIQIDRPVTHIETNLTPKWWRPIWAHPIVGVLIIIYTLALVAALEAIQRISRSSHPLVADANIYLASLLGSVLPALLLVGAKLSLSSLAGCIAMFSPFTTVLSNRTLSKNALLRSSVYKMPVINFIQSLRAGQLNVALASLAAVCGGFLTIFASGLLSSDFNIRVLNETVTQRDSFNISSVFQIDNPGLPDELFSLTDQYNATYPDRTWKALVYPSVNIGDVGPDGYWYGDVTMQIPAVRGSLNCTFVPELALELSFVQSSENSDSLVSIVHKNKDVPANCMSANETYRMDNYSMIMGSMNQAYAASFRQWLPSSDANASTVADEQFPGCPNLLYIIGYFDMDAETASNVSAVYCYQTIEQVETNTTFGYSTQQSVSSTPVVNESSVIILQDHAHYPGMKWFSSVTHFTESHDLQVFDSIPVRSDVFTQHLVLGIDGIPLEQVIGPENQPRLLSAIQHLYGLYMVQPITSLMRTKPNIPPPTYAATFNISGWTYIRFTQSETSKLVLQVLLCIMAVCGTLAYVLTPMKKVLMHSPNSIAGTMTLLAGSRLCGRGVLGEGSEYLDDRGLGVLVAGYVFRMGWNEEEEDNGGGGGDEEAKKQSEDSGDGRLTRGRRYGIEVAESR